jgi:Guanylate-binding protein, C-terminal domain/Guanylate-binding protein, N-terminal domain
LTQVNPKLFYLQNCHNLTQKYTPDGDEITPTQYLKIALDPVKGFDKGTVEKNRIRSMLTSFFSVRQCVTLMRPCHSEEEMGQVDLVPFDKLRPEFQKGMTELRSMIFGQQLVPKALEGRPLNGLMFSGLVESYVAAINSGGVPTLSTAWDSISEAECLSAMEKALDSYEAEMLDLHDAALGSATQFYKHRAVGLKSNEYLAKLELEVLKLKQEYVEFNEMESKEFCTQLTETLFNLKLSSILSDEDLVSQSNFISSFKKEWDVLADKYEKTESKGPAAQGILSSFYHNRFLNCIEQFSVVLRDFFSKEIRSLSNEIRDLSAALSLVTTERNVLNDANVDRERKLKEAESQLRTITSQCTQQEAILADYTEKLRTALSTNAETKDLSERKDTKIASLNAKLSENAIQLKQIDGLKLENGKYAEEIRGLNKQLEDVATAAAEKAERKKNKKPCVIS